MKNLRLDEFPIGSEVYRYDGKSQRAVLYTRTTEDVLVTTEDVNKKYITLPSNAYNDLSHTTEGAEINRLQAQIESEKHQLTRIQHDLIKSELRIKNLNERMDKMKIDNPEYFI